MPLLARVTAVNPDSHSLDVELLRDGRKLSGVMVLSPSASHQSGMSHLPGPIENDNSPCFVMIDFCEQEIPVILGYVFPQVGQMQFDDHRRIDRHHSDVYTQIDEQGNVELYHPAGVMVAINASGEHEDLTGKDYDGNWALTKNTDKDLIITIQNKTTKLTMDGNQSITATGNLTVNGWIKATQDVTAGRISLKNHLHGNGNNGDDTTEPK